ncbi:MULTISPECIES: bifunctional YncE family protein/alkaline phosphatase family protein [unclassified Nocardioides]|uniref:bifunctional YncE family protein/alkaline phosphatase family protein n=1 Tax=unclassified Nocardioides TaxID=2615069 RepID=UPI0006F7208F|nr:MULTISPECIES: bifunctional YncE family protein/alkaline phosphatase family protein [unclassified Nocardioides]KQY64420.1 phosphoesterase [Nocardioides sp. Root140]KRF18191.1 phosphoesterase [Nocardioides sp. Soil796]
MHVKRNRVVRPARRRLAGKLPVGLLAGGLAIVLGAGVANGSTVGFGENEVGTEYDAGLQISSNQILKPQGERLVTEYGKFMGSTVSPDGRYLAATANDRSVSLQIFDLESYELVWRGGTASGVDMRLSDNTVGQESPIYSPDGDFLWMPNATGLTRFPVVDGGALGPGTKVTLPTVDGRQPLTAGLAYSPDGATLYAAVNGQNTVAAIDPVLGTVKRTWDVGIAPRQLRFVGERLYVSDEGGRRARAGDDTIESYGTQVPADPYLGTSTTGQVSVIDTTDTAAPVGTIAVGLHPTAMHVRDGILYVANTNDDTVSVIDTSSDEVVQTISTQPWQGSDVGYEPDAITFHDDRLLVSLGRANAIAVYKLGENAIDPVSYVGLVPTDYYPEDVFSVDDKVVVANRRGIDARGPLITFDKGYGTTPATGHGTHGTTASLTRFALPSDSDIRETTTPTVFSQNGWGDADTDVKHAKGRKAKPVPVPRRIGDPSTIKHVFMLVKENRTYDQIHGDMPEGNGDASLAQFGQEVTPNLHALSRQFGLYDNTYDIGTNSAEGHSWIMQGDNPEYTESSAGEYIRSYDSENDVLGHQRSGFLWTAVQSAGHTARNHGEFMIFENKPSGATWQQYHCAATSVEGGGDPAQLYDPAIRLDTHSPIPSLDAISDHDAPMFDMQIPDQYRYQIWKQDFEKNGPADFNMMWLSDDHTGGPVSARSNVAGGDLAVGKIVETISHSKYWKDSAIFVVEDDSQNGPDHVDGHRAPIQVISPWAAHGKTISTYYSQISMVRTIEQILGAEPLNQKVAAATPMFDAFQKRPDNTPYTALPNRISLTENIVIPPACGLDTPTGARTAKAPPVPDKFVSYSQAWEKWAARQHLSGKNPKPDFANPELMNRYTWYDAHHWDLSYPGDPKVYLPNEVPGAALPGADAD